MKKENLRGLEKLVNVGAYVKIWINQKNERKLKVMIDKNSLTAVYVADDLGLLLEQPSNRITKSTKVVKSNLFPALEWLLSKGFYITIVENNDYFCLNIKAEDEYKYLKHGMFQTLTLKDNGIIDLFETAEAWASTLQRHILGDVCNLEQ